MTESIGWDYFNVDLQYRDELIKRLKEGVEMDSAKGLAKWMLKYFEGDLKIIDFGSGPGHYYPVLRKIYDKGKIFYKGVDIVPGSIESGKNYFSSDENVEFELGSLLEPDALYVDQNCIISANTLPHVPTIEPLLAMIKNNAGIKYFAFRMLIDCECVQIKKHLKQHDFKNMYDANYQHNNIYSVEYFQALLGDDWKLKVEEDEFDPGRLDKHSMPEQRTNPFYGNRVSRREGNHTFKGALYMPWRYIIGCKLDK